MIAIIDYGVGNLRSVEKALQNAGGDAYITSEAGDILKADAVVLPGVGAFSEAMQKLNESGTAGAVKQTIKDNKPFLGICLGMQMLFDYSEEGGDHIEGLGIFSGSIKKFSSDINKKIPHMGWNTVKLSKKSDLFNGIEDDSYFYFVHSYYLNSIDKEIVAATTEYGYIFDSCISKGNVFATQFHPEKSGECGLRMLRNFVDNAEKFK